MSKALPKPPAPIPDTSTGINEWLTDQAEEFYWEVTDLETVADALRSALTVDDFRKALHGNVNQFRRCHDKLSVVLKAMGVDV